MAASSQADVAEAREALAARLERMARLVRANTTASADEFDAAYREVGKLEKTIRHIVSPATAKG
jgi:hypothetical protein